MSSVLKPKDNKLLSV